MAIIRFLWNGEAMTPISRFRKAADEAFVVGAEYDLEELQHRSSNSHRHFFASLHESWLNLPESQAERFLSEEHFRKWCLIKAGFRDERTFVASSKAEAQRLAAFVKPLDDYAVVTVRDCVVAIYTAKSQSVKAMGKADFQASKQAVLEIAAGMIGVTTDELSRAAG